jgi:hypothetical protein
MTFSREQIFQLQCELAAAIAERLNVPNMFGDLATVKDVRDFKLWTAPEGTTVRIATFKPAVDVTIRVHDPEDVQALLAVAGMLHTPEEPPCNPPTK